MSNDLTQQNKPPASRVFFPIKSLESLEKPRDFRYNKHVEPLGINYGNLIGQLSKVSD